MTFISYSQNLEDVMLWRALLHVDRGFYIDVGAWDPWEDSVTLAFYERGWRGINIEPNADKYRALTDARSEDITLGVAVSDTPGEQVFYDVLNTGLSTLDAAIAERHRVAGWEVRERSVAVMRLRDICATYAPQDIHFLKIDVEGLEAAVLASADFARCRPWLIVVEATEPNSPEPSHAAWEPRLLEAGYHFVYFDGLNRYYVANEKACELAPAFSCPPNVFDDYVSVAGIRKAVRTQEAGLLVAELLNMANDRNSVEHAAQQVHSKTAALGSELHGATAPPSDAEMVISRAERAVKLAQAEPGRQRISESWRSVQCRIKIGVRTLGYTIRATIRRQRVGAAASNYSARNDHSNRDSYRRDCEE